MRASGGDRRHPGATDYGLTVAGELGAGLGERGWTVVSGLAFGIDAAAHRGALAAGGATIAVLASGVDVAYPRAHRSLYDQVVAEGLAVSEQPPGDPPQRARFLVRNRLIAALSAGTVVVEAAPRSGARSTARHAGELFRHVMAVPGPVTSTLSAGCHQLLRDRPDAVLVTKTDEVIEQVGALGEFAERVSGPVRRRDLLGPIGQSGARCGADPQPCAAGADRSDCGHAGRCGRGSPRRTGGPRPGGGAAEASGA